jgi:aromatase
MNIFWAYQEVDGGVEMRWEQEFHVREELPFDDEAMAAHLLKNSAIQMAAIKERIEKAAVARS